MIELYGKPIKLSLRFEPVIHPLTHYMNRSMALWTPIIKLRP